MTSNLTDMIFIMTHALR